MGKRLPKAALLAEARKERAALDQLLAPLTPRQMTQPDVTQAGWSVKDVLSHLIGWQQMNLGWHEAALRGESPAVPAPGLKWSDVREINERIYRRHRRRSLKVVLADYAAYHGKMLDAIERTSDADLTAIGRFAWTGPTWTLSDYFRANTASHDRWACKHLRKWLRANAQK